MPLADKRWYIQRLIKEMQKSQSSKADSSEARALSGKMRPEAPAKLKRFT